LPDVALAGELQPGATDETRLGVAASEARLILTSDKDFGELIYAKE